MRKKRTIFFLFPILVFFGTTIYLENKSGNLDFEKISSFIQNNLLEAICKDLPLDIDDSKDLDTEEITVNSGQENYSNFSSSKENFLLKSNKFSPILFLIQNKHSSISSPPPEA